MALSLQEQMQLIKRLDEENKLVGAKGIGEALFNTLGQTAATSASGLGGLWDLLTGGDINSAVDTVNSVQKTGQSWLPDLSPEGQRAMQNAQQVFEPVGQFMQESGKNAGDMVFDWTGSPLAATAVQTGVQGLPELIGLGAVTKPRVQTSGMPASLLDEPVIPNKPQAPANLLDAPQPKLPAPTPEPAPQGLLSSPVRKPTPPPDTTPKLLKEPTGQKARVNDSTYTYSGLEQAMNDMVAEYTAKGKDLTMTRAQLGKRLAGRGITAQEMAESQLNVKGSEVVNIKDQIDRLNTRSRNPSNRMELYQERGRYEQLVPDITPEILANTEMKPVPYDQTTSIYDSHIPVWKRAYSSGEVRPSERQRYTNIIQRAARDAAIQTGTPWESVAKGLDNVEKEYGISRTTGYPMDVTEAMQAVRRGSDVDNQFFESMNRNIQKILQSDYEQNPIMGYEFQGAQGNPVEVRYKENPTYSESPVYEIYQDGIRNNWIPASSGMEGILGELTKSMPISRTKYSDWKRGTPIGYEETSILQDTGYPKSRDSHFKDVEGYLGHTRSMGQKTSDGLSTRHVFEVQSGVHQEGRKSGYKSIAESDRLSDLKYALSENSKDLSTVTDKITDRDTMLNIVKKMTEHDGESWADALAGEMYNASLEYPDVNRVALESLAESKLIIEATAMLEDPQYLDMYSGVPEFTDLAKELQTARAKNKALQREYEGSVKALSRKSEDVPLKGNVISKQSLYQNIISAIENGDDGISIANAYDQEVFLDPLREKYGDNESKWPTEAKKQASEARALYFQQYERTLPAMLRDIGKKYGVKPVRKKLNDPELNKDGREHWFLPISPEMKKSIMDRGVPLYGKIDDGLLKERDPAFISGGLMDGARYA